MSELDRNAVDPVRIRRNWQRLVEWMNAGQTVSLTAASGLEFVSGALQINLDGSTLVLSSSGLKISDDGVGADQLGIVTTKGDLLAYSTAPDRLPVGTDGQVLIADSTQATGLRWADISEICAACA
jgi:hypothetical protein